MKKINTIIIAALALTTVLASCKKVLEKTDPQNLSVDEVFNDPAIAQLNLDYIYAQNVPGWFGNGTVSAIATAGPSNLTEEAQSDNAFVKGTITSESVGDIGTSNSSATNYGKIRLINNFIQDVNGGTLPQATKDLYSAQALFWRAFRYFELVKLYGGVPIVTTPLNAVGSDALSQTFLARSSTTVTFKQIITDLNTAITSLPANYGATDYGRITKGAAQAFLARVLVTWASPQFNSPITSLPATATSVVPTTDITRWQQAYDMSNAAIATLTAAGYGLYSKWDYTMWTTEGANGAASKNPEAVMVTEYNSDATANGADNESYTGASEPKAISTSGGSNQPTWDLVSAFPMADGKAPGTSTKYPYAMVNSTTPPTNFYANRDPRFYQTIAYNGVVWPINATPTYRVWTYNYYTNTAGTNFKSTELVAASSTGFYMRKAVDPSITAANLPNAFTDWIEIRYAEVLLNHAEAAAETNHLSEALADLIQIRKRAGIEAGTDNNYGLNGAMAHDDMINAIMNERQIEFAFEGKRYWDLRRRKLLEVTLNGRKRMGLTIYLKNTGTSTDYIATTRDASATTGTAFDTYFAANFTLQLKSLDSYNLAYQTADYFFGIPLAAYQNNPSLQQNNTWPTNTYGNGIFDPIQ